MLSLTNIFKLLLFVGIFLTVNALPVRVFSHHNNNSAIYSIAKSSSLKDNHAESFVLEDDDLDHLVKYFGVHTIANVSKSYFFDFGIFQGESPKNLPQKFTLQFPISNHLFILFHCWKIICS